MMQVPSKLEARDSALEVSKTARKVPRVSRGEANDADDAEGTNLTANITALTQEISSIRKLAIGLYSVSNSDRSTFVTSSKDEVSEAAQKADTDRKSQPCGAGYAKEEDVVLTATIKTTLTQQGWSWPPSSQSRAEELAAIHNTIQVLTDEDAPEVKRRASPE